MGSYLEAYGASEEQRAKRSRLLKRLVILVVVLAIVAGTAYAFLKNYPEEKQVKSFVELLKDKNYQAAYKMWGCTDQTPCRDYAFTRFLEDWGPKSEHADAGAARVGEGDSCGTGVVVPVSFKGSEPVALWVERGSHVLGFSPDPECRKPRWHFKEFLRSLFGKQPAILVWARGPADLDVP
jgi:hypothetical protein